MNTWTDRYRTIITITILGIIVLLLILFWPIAIYDLLTSLGAVADWLNGHSGVVVAVATIVLAIIASRSLAHTQRLSKVASLAYEPEAKVEVTPRLLPSQNSTEEVAAISVTCENTGRVPLQILQIFLHAYWIDPDFGLQVMATPHFKKFRSLKLSAGPFTDEFLLSLNSWPEGQKPPANTLKGVQAYALLEYRGLAQSEGEVSQVRSRTITIK